jgi:hypothetical protein
MFLRRLSIRTTIKDLRAGRTVCLLQPWYLFGPTVWALLLILAGAALAWTGSTSSSATSWTVVAIGGVFLLTAIWQRPAICFRLDGISAYGGTYQKWSDVVDFAVITRGRGGRGISIRYGGGVDPCNLNSSFGRHVQDLAEFLNDLHSNMLELADSGPPRESV